MSREQLSVVTYSIIVSRILYALPAWCGFLSGELTNKIDALFRCLKRFGFTTSNITVSDLRIETPLVVIFSANYVYLIILCIICYCQRESTVTCEIVVIPMNSRSVVLTCIKSLIIQSLYFTFDFSHL